MEIIDKKLKTILKACEDKKAIDIEEIDLMVRSSLTDYFVIVSGNSTNQVRAIADGVEKDMKENLNEEVVKEGYEQGRWVLMDYNEVILHIFYKEERDFYNLESMWEKVENIK